MRNHPQGDRKRLVGEAFAVSDYRACTECGRSLQLNEANFHKSKDGFHSQCKRCRNKMARAGRKRKTNAKLEKIEHGAVRLFTEAATLGGAHIPHSSELLEVIMEYFGGVRGFANAFMKQYYDSAAGGSFRTKMIDSVVRLVSTNTALGGAKKPLELMSEDELESELAAQVTLAAVRLLEEKKSNGAALQKLPVVVSGEFSPSDGAMHAPGSLERDRAVSADDGHGNVRPLDRGECAQ